MVVLDVVSVSIWLAFPPLKFKIIDLRKLIISVSIPFILLYECLQTGNHASNIKFSWYTVLNTNDVEYSIFCRGCKNCFGCVGLNKKEYCILNRQYTKEEYFKLREKIINHMRERGEWGEFFPPKFSPVCYNETQGQIYMPLTKEEALAQGYKWQDDLGGTYGKETINFPPDEINQTDKSITKEILKCANCSKNYNIVLPEYELYKRMVVPIPELCPDCRYLNRQSLRSPRKLWHRKCMKEGCQNEFETPYALERKEIIYCEKCYQQEVY